MWWRPGSFLSREEVYERVWSTPTLLLSKEWGISDVAIAKRCKHMGIPKPPRGYWAKVHAGKTPKVPPLPAIKPGQSRGMYLVQPRPENQRLEADDFAKALAHNIALPQVSEVLANPHEVVKTLKRTHRLSVSDSQQLRALCILDALLKGFDEGGYPVQLDDHHSPYVHIHGENVRIQIWEQTSSKRRNLSPEQLALPKHLRPSQFEYVTNGYLTIAVGQRSYVQGVRFIERKNSRLEGRLAEVVVAAFAEAGLMAEERRRREEEQRRQEEAKRRYQLELSRINNLTSFAKAYNHALQLQQFLDALAEHWQDASPEQQRWLEWAQAYVAQQDPISSGKVDQLSMGPDD